MNIKIRQERSEMKYIFIISFIILFIIFINSLIPMMFTNFIKYIKVNIYTYLEKKSPFKDIRYDALGIYIEYAGTVREAILTKTDAELLKALRKNMEVQNKILKMIYYSETAGHQVNAYAPEQGDTNREGK